MSKKLSVLLEVRVDDSVKAEDLLLTDHDSIDGFQLSRYGSDVTSNFLLKSAEIICATEEQEEDEA